MTKQFDINTLMDSISRPTQNRRSVFRGVVIFCLMIRCGLALSVPSEVKSFDVETPHPFGYVIGDIVNHTVYISVDKTFEINQSFLPQPGPVKRWLEIRRVDLHQSSDIFQTHFIIDIKYQLFKSVKNTDTLAIPPWELTLRSVEKTIELDIPPWNFNYSPLIPPQVKDEDVIIRPGVRPNTIPVKTHIWILTASVVGLILTLLCLAWFYDLLPFLKRNRGPFSHAYPLLKKLGRAHDDLIGYRDALLLLHRAFDHTHGKTVFAENLSAFFSDNPAFRIHEKETEAFFQVSRDVFFADTQPPSQYSIDWLVALCKRYKQTEIRQ